MKFLLSLISALFGALFRKSEAERLGEAEEKVKTYEAAQKIHKETKKIVAPTTKDALDDILRSGRLCLVFTLLLTSCTTVAVPYCQDVLPWTKDAQIQMVNDLQKLPPTSPVRSAIADYAKMREEARICNSINGD